ncbi:MAG: ribosome-associated translation inhibitor RaiA [Anaerolineae bacterium]
MELRITSRNFEASDGLKQYIEKKITRVERHLPGVQSVSVELASQMMRTQGEQYVAQVTARASKAVMRAEVRASDSFEAVDAVFDKLQRQVDRYQGKRKSRSRGRGVNADALAAAAVAPEIAVEETADDEEEPIIRRKRFAVHPMDDQEAAEQMELLGHDFYLFQNSQTGQVNVVYRRKEGGYGILEPDIA